MLGGHGVYRGIPYTDPTKFRYISGELDRISSVVTNPTPRNIHSDSVAAVAERLKMANSAFPAGFETARIVG